MIRGLHPVHQREAVVPELPEHVLAVRLVVLAAEPGFVWALNALQGV